MNFNKKSIVNYKANPLTTTQRVALGTTLNTNDKGIEVFDTTLNQVFFWSGSTWVSGSSSSGGVDATSSGNGLSMSGNNVILGGTLNQNTTITTGSNTLTVAGSNGLRYATDISSNYTNRSLVDKQYVDTLVNNNGGENTTAGNGLSIVSNKVVLGGTLNQNTIINGTNFNLTFNNNITTFDSNKFRILNELSGFNFGGSGFNAPVNTIAIQTDNKILVGGEFQTYNGVDCSDRLVRLNSNGTLDTTFNSGGSGLNSSVNILKLQPDGKILVGGAFTGYNVSDTSDKLIRLNSNGTLDTTFNSGGSGFDNSIETIFIQTDGKILVGGLFTTYNGVNCSDNLVRLNSDGTLDTSFNSGGSGFSSTVRSLYLQPDGKILVGGAFLTYNGTNCSDRFVRLNSDGTLDTTFNNGGSGFDNDVYSIFIQTDGKILVGGYFQTYNGAPCPDSLVRLNSDGTLDTTFNSGGSGFNSPIDAIYLQSDGKIMAGGYFTQYNGVNCPDYLVRLNSDGTLDTTFNSGGSGAGAPIKELYVYSSGEILIGGFFVNHNGINCPDYLVRLNSDGTLETKKDIEVYIDGDIGLLRYGNNYRDEFTDRTIIDKEYVDDLIDVINDSIIDINNNLSNINQENTSAGNGLSMSGNNVILGGTLNQNTTILSDNYGLTFDTKDFNIKSKLSLFNYGGSGFNSTLYSIDIQTDGKILVGGLFTTYNGVNCPDRLVRLNSDGTLDTSFNSGGSGFNDGVYSISIQADGKILVAGRFTTYNGVDCPDYLVRLNSDGTLDTSFNSGGSGFSNNILATNIYTISIQTDGKILVGGYFSDYNGIDCPNRLVRLNSDGTLDTSFNSGGSGFDNSIETIFIQTDGKILVGGSFISYNGTPCPDSLVRLNSDGTLDSTFNSGGSGFNSNVFSISIQSDNKILVAGHFTTYNGSECSDNLVRLNSDGTLDTSFNSGGSGFDYSIETIFIQTDGKILAGGLFTTYNGVNCSDNLVRLNSDGTLDTSFNSGGSGFSSTVRSLYLQPDGKILVGGGFSTYNNNVVPIGLVRLNSDGSVDDYLDVDIFIDRNDGLLRYGADYSANYTIRSLVDKQYVDTLANNGGENTTAGNGLSIVSNKVVLGGTLNQNTTIDGSHGLTIESSSLNIVNTIKGFNYGGSGVNGIINSIKIQSDNKILIGGSFNTYNLTPTPINLIRLNSDGSLDTSFNVSGLGFNEVVYAIEIQNDGKILVGGNFTTYNNINYNYLIRLNNDGSLDTSFNSGGSGFDNYVNDILILSDSKILVGGNFTTYNGVSNSQRIIKLNSNGTLDTTFNSGGSGFDNNVKNIILLSDEKLLIGGYFSEYNNINCPNGVVRLNSDGSLDSTFNNNNQGIESLGYVTTLSLQVDGKILVGGSFNTYNLTPTPINLIRLNSDGSVDTSFNSGGIGFDSQVNNIIILRDGKILVGGNFSTYNTTSLKYYLVRLNSDGSLDTTFNSGGLGFNNPVHTLSLLDNNSILVGGMFTEYNNSACSDAVVRLNNDGSIDDTESTINVYIDDNNGLLRYDNNYYLSFTNRSLIDKEYVDNAIKKLPIIINVDNGIGIYNNAFILGGSLTKDTNINTLNSKFTIEGTNGLQYTDNISSYYTNRSLVDKEYVDTTVNNLSLENTTAGNGLSLLDNKIVLGGELIDNTTIYSYDYGINIYAKTSLNTFYGGFNFNKNGFNNYVFSTNIQTDGKILVGGEFTLYNNNTHTRIIRLNIDGTIDNTFYSGSGFNSVVFTTQIQQDGKILVGGEFTLYNGVTTPNLVRLNSDGTLDTSFNNGGSGFNGSVIYIAIQTDGKILVGGGFNSYNGVICSSRIVRLNSDGTLDTSFNNGGSGFIGNTNIITLQTDGKILVGGGFTTYNGVNCPDNLVRLNSDGTLDTSFNNGGSGFDMDVLDIMINNDGKILVGGVFTTYNGVICSNRIVRLNSDGTLDTSFNNGGSGFDYFVAKITIQLDGKILVGGGFTTYNGIDCPDKFVRLNSDGTLDTSFNNGGSGFDEIVNNIHIFNDGKILVGGNFTTYNNSNISNRIIVLNSDGSIFYPDMNRVLMDGAGGLRYENNYHTDFTTRSLVDKEYVDTLVNNNGVNGTNAGLIGSKIFINKDVNNNLRFRTIVNGGGIGVSENGNTIEILNQHTNITDMNDTFFGTLLPGDIIQWDGGSWVNSQLKTINSNSIVGSGNISVGDVLIGGNTVTSSMAIGTNSNHALTLETNNIIRQTIDNDGLVTYNGVSGNAGIVRMRRLEILDADGVTWREAFSSSTTNVLSLGVEFTSISVVAGMIVNGNLTTNANLITNTLRNRSVGTPLQLTTLDRSGANTDNIYLKTGDDNSGATLSGSILLDTGTTVGGSRGGVAFFNGNVAPTWNSLQRGIFVGNATAVPAGNPTNGFFMYGDSGVPTFKNINGDVVKLETRPAVTTTQGIADVLTNLGFLASSSINTNENTTSGNGLTMNGTTVELGGNLIKNTSILGTTYDLNIDSKYWSVGSNGLFWTDSGSINFSANIVGLLYEGFGNSRLALGDTEFQLKNNYIDVNATGDTLTIEDKTATKSGLEYLADYSANYTNRSLVDKAYVDTAVANSSSGSGGISRTILTANNQIITAGSNPNTDYVYKLTGNNTITLPTAVGNTNSYKFKLSSGTTTINTTSSELIDGGLTAIMSNINSSFTLISDGANWMIF